MFKGDVGVSRVKLLLLVISIIIVIVAGIVAVAVMRFDSDSLQKHIVTILEGSVDATSEVSGDVEFGLYPQPHVVIKGVKLVSKDIEHDLPLAEIPRVEVHISLLSFLIGQGDPETIILKNPILNIELSRQGKWNWRFKQSDTDIDTDILIHFGVVNYYSQSNNFFKRFEEVNMRLSTEDAALGPFAVEGELGVRHGVVMRYYGLKSVFTLQQNAIDMVLDISSESFHARYDGAIQVLANGTIHSDGEVNVAGPSFPNFFWVMTGGLQHIKGDSIRYGVDDPFTVRAMLKNDDDVMRMSDIVINSETVIGKGDAVSYLNHKGFTDINLNIDYARLDLLLDAAADWDMSIDQVSIPEQSINADIRITELNYRSDKAFDIRASIHSAAQAVSILPLSAMLPGQGSIEIYGNFDTLHWKSEYDNGMESSGAILAQAIPEFKGQFYSYGTQLSALIDWFHIDAPIVKTDRLGRYAVQGDIRIAPYVVEVNNVKAVLDDVFFSGKSQISHSIGRTKIINTVSIEKLDVDRYLDIERYTERINPNEYFRDLSQLERDIYFESDIRELVYDGKRINDLYFVLAVNPAYVGLDRVGMRSEKADFMGSIIVDLKGMDPRINIMMDAKHIDTSVFDQTPKDQVVQQDGGGAPSAPAGNIWSDEPMQLTWLTKFNGDVDIRIEQLQHKRMSLNNLIFLGNIKDLVLQIDTFTARLAGGSLDVKGKFIGTSVPTFGFSFSLTKAESLELLSTLFGYENISGKVSIVGSLGSSGFSMARIISQMNGTFSFAGRGIDIEGLDLHHLVENLFVIPEERVFDLIAEDLSSGKTQLYAADGIFIIKSGILAIKDMVISTTRTSGALSGNFDLKTWVMALLSQFSFVAYDPMLQSNATLSIGLKMSGLADNLNVQSNFKAIDRYFKRRKEQLDLRK